MPTGIPHSEPCDSQRFPRVRLLIFDLDGTLIDSKLDLANSVNATLRHMGRPALPHETIFRYVGDGASMLVKRALGGKVGEAEAARGLAYFLSYYRMHMLDHTVMYAGVPEGLQRLKDKSMAVLTNKPVRFSRDILAGLKIASYFHTIYGGNSFEKKKPDPIGVHALLRALPAEPAEAMMVGDSRVDVQTARNAGIWCCGVSYGLGAAGFREDPPDVIVDSLADLPNYL